MTTEPEEDRDHVPRFDSLPNEDTR